LKKLDQAHEELLRRSAFDPRQQPSRSTSTRDVSNQVKAALADFPFPGCPCPAEFPGASARAGYPAVSAARYPAVSVECLVPVSWVRLPSGLLFAGKRCAIAMVPKGGITQSFAYLEGRRRRCGSKGRGPRSFIWAFWSPDKTWERYDD
jgi:hypothetical protein